MSERFWISIFSLEISLNFLTNFWISNPSARFWICRGEAKCLERDWLLILPTIPSVAGQDSHPCLIRFASEIAESGLQFVFALYTYTVQYNSTRLILLCPPGCIYFALLSSVQQHKT